MSWAIVMADLFSDVPQPPPDGPYSRPRANYRQQAVPACDPKAPAEARPRLSRQCEAILDRLRRGRVGIRELMGIACNYRARVSDLRAGGYDVRCIDHNYETGLTWYALFQDGKEVGQQFIN